MKSFKEYLSESILLEQNLNNFVDFACDHLNLKKKPKILLVKDRDDTMTTASYSPKSKKIKIYSKNRAFFDIARSIAHELVHHMQQKTGKELNGDTGSDCENEANAVAGKIVRLYGKKNPDFYNS